MPLYADLYHTYLANTAPLLPPSSYGVGYSNYSTLPRHGSSTSSYSRPGNYYPSSYTPSVSSYSSSRYIPKLAPIVEARNYGRIDSTALMSPKTYTPRRPLKINTSDIDVSASKYQKDPEVNEKETREPPPPDAIHHHGGTINRNRRVVRLSTIRKVKSRSQSTERKSSKGSSRSSDEPQLPTSPKNAAVESPKASWRDGMPKEFFEKPKKRASEKSPGDILLEKFKIKDNDTPPPSPPLPTPPSTPPRSSSPTTTTHQQQQQLLPRAASPTSPPQQQIATTVAPSLPPEEELRPFEPPQPGRRTSINLRKLEEVPTFKEICCEISSEKITDDLNAEELRKRASAIIDEEMQFFNKLRRSSSGAVHCVLEKKLEVVSGGEENERNLKSQTVDLTHVSDNELKAFVEEITVENAAPQKPKFNVIIEAIEETKTVRLPNRKKRTRASSRKMEKPIEPVSIGEEQENGERGSVDFWGCIKPSESRIFHLRAKSRSNIFSESTVDQKDLNSDDIELKIAEPPVPIVEPKKRYSRKLSDRSKTVNLKNINEKIESSTRKAKEAEDAKKKPVSTSKRSQFDKSSPTILSETKSTVLQTAQKKPVPKKIGIESETKVPTSPKIAQTIDTKKAAEIKTSDKIAKKEINLNKEADSKQLDEEKSTKLNLLPYKIVKKDEEVLKDAPKFIQSNDLSETSEAKPDVAQKIDSKKDDILDTKMAEIKIPNYPDKKEINLKLITDDVKSVQIDVKSEIANIKSEMEKIKSKTTDNVEALEQSSMMDSGKKKTNATTKIEIGCSAKSPEKQSQAAQGVNRNESKRALTATAEATAKTITADSPKPQTAQKTSSKIKETKLTKNAQIGQTSAAVASKSEVAAKTEEGDHDAAREKDDKANQDHGSGAILSDGGSLSKFPTFDNLNNLSVETDTLSVKETSGKVLPEEEPVKRTLRSSAVEDTEDALHQIVQRSETNSGSTSSAKEAKEDDNESEDSGDDWSSDEEAARRFKERNYLLSILAMASDKPYQPPAPKKRLDFDNMKKCYKKEEKTFIPLVAKPKPLWKYVRRNKPHKKRGLHKLKQMREESERGDSECSESSSTSEATTTELSRQNSKTSESSETEYYDFSYPYHTRYDENNNSGSLSARFSSKSVDSGIGGASDASTSQRDPLGTGAIANEFRENYGPSSQSSSASYKNSHSSDSMIETSYVYTQFQKTGKITPPATVIPRFRKYTIDDFNFLFVLGKGSFGKVFLAELKNTEYYYAVKGLKKDIVLEDDDVECTLIERKVLALGTKHPFLCHLFATFQTDSHLFFVMEYLNGGDLMFHIQRSGRFSEDRARFYAAEIVSGLKFLHKKGIIYRDLKLDNILLDYQGHARIADFGMCKLEIYLDRTADSFCGTPDYMAPEIIKGQQYNQAVDWWSFGVLCYEMLIGQSPFSGCDEDELFWSICNEIPWFPHYLSKEALRFLQSLLEKDSSIRLGMLESMEGEILYHPFFNEIDWEKLDRREIQPPFKPEVSHPLDTCYFENCFTKERARLTLIDRNILRSINQEQFEGFTYTNPNATLT